MLKHGIGPSILGDKYKLAPWLTPEFQRIRWRSFVRLIHRERFAAGVAASRNRREMGSSTWIESTGRTP